MEIYWRLKCDVGSGWKYTGGCSVMWRVGGNIQEAECDVDSGWKYTGG